MDKFAFSLGIIFLGLVLGYTVQLLANQMGNRFPLNIETLRKTLQKIAFFFFDPIIYMGAIWDIKLNELKIIALPFMGIFALLLGGVLAFIFARLLKLTRKQTGAYIICGGFTNIGSIGGLLCFTFLGEAGFALASFYKTFEMFVYYIVGFPVARSYSEDAVDSNHFKERARKVLLDPFVLVAAVSMLAGLLLNISGVERPDFYGSVNAVLIPTASILLLSSIGMAMHFERARQYVKEGLLIALIKFAIIPIVVTAVSCLLGLGKIDDGLPLKVVLILSSMPVGFTAMVPPTIYNLDVNLANAAWMVTNFSLILVVPLLQYLVNL